jgi:hypothetical protein
MTLNFLNTPCAEPAREDNEFGLCDDQDGKKAYSSIANKDNWIATVKNNRRIKLRFTAVDKCVIQDHEYKD